MCMLEGWGWGGGLYVCMFEGLRDGGVVCVYV